MGNANTGVGVIIAATADVIISQVDHLAYIRVLGRVLEAKRR